MNYKRLIDGTIVFPMNGKPPPMEVPGYEVDEGDPYVFRPTLPPCKARTEVMLKVPCCKDPVPVKHCTKFGLYSMIPGHCIECNRRGESDPPT